LLRLFGIPMQDYKRFHNFLMAHDCKVDYRSFRQGTPEPARRHKVVLPPLRPAAQKAEGENREAGQVTPTDEPVGADRF
jgi:hypothetical protein